MLDDCGGRGNGERDAEGLPRDADARAGSKEGSGKGEAVGWTGRMGVGTGAMGRQRRGGGPFGRGDREGEKRKEVGIQARSQGARSQARSQIQRDRKIIHA